MYCADGGPNSGGVGCGPVLARSSRRRWHSLARARTHNLFAPLTKWVTPAPLSRLLAVNKWHHAATAFIAMFPTLVGRAPVEAGRVQDLRESNQPPAGGAVMTVGLNP